MIFPNATHSDELRELNFVLNIFNSRVISKNVNTKCSKNEEFRGRPRGSLILEHLEMMKIHENIAGDHETCLDECNF